MSGMGTRPPYSSCDFEAKLLRPRPRTVGAAARRPRPRAWPPRPFTGRAIRTDELRNVDRPPCDVPSTAEREATAAVEDEAAGVLSIRILHAAATVGTSSARRILVNRLCACAAIRGEPGMRPP